MTQATAFSQSLAQLLPQGFAWPRGEDSTWVRLLLGTAASLKAHHDWVHNTALRWLPTQLARLAEWEEACGLPDDCYSADQSDAGRLQALLARLRGVPRLVDDGSPAAPAALEAVCAALGALCTVTVNTPFRVGQRVGERLGQNGRMHIHVLRNDSGLPDEQLVLRLGCALERIVPARYVMLLQMADVVVVRPGALGWPGARTNCEAAGSALVIIDLTTWDGLPTTWDAWNAWSSASGSITYEHTVVDAGFLRRVLLVVDTQANGAVAVQCSTSPDGVGWSAWGAIPSELVSARFFKLRWTVTGTNPELLSATISIRY